MNFFYFHEILILFSPTRSNLRTRFRSIWKSHHLDPGETISLDRSIWTFIKFGRRKKKTECFCSNNTKTHRLRCCEEETTSKWNKSNSDQTIHTLWYFNKTDIDSIYDVILYIFLYRLFVSFTNVFHSFDGVGVDFSNISINTSTDKNISLWNNEKLTEENDKSLNGRKEKKKKKRNQMVLDRSS